MQCRLSRDKWSGRQCRVYCSILTESKVSQQTEQPVGNLCEVEVADPCRRLEHERLIDDDDQATAVQEMEIEN